MLCPDWLSDSTLGGDWLYFSQVKNAIREADWTYRFTCEITAHIEFYLQALLPKILTIYTIKMGMSQFGDIISFFSYLQFQFLAAEEAPEEPPPVTDSATLKHFAREAEVDHDGLCDIYFITQYSRRNFFFYLTCK